ncbi:MAG: hypothetical protein QM723_28240 [Myxococcaceae bacterium]
MRLALATLLLCSGCYSFSTLGRARVLEPGKVEVMAAPEGLAITNGKELAIRPVGDLGVRYGLSERVELDAKLTTLGLTLGPKVQLSRSPSCDCGVDIALAPAVAYTVQDKLTLELPVMFGINFTGGHQLVLAPRIAWQVRVDVPGADHPVSDLLAGASVGFVWQFSKHVALMPEVAVLAQPWAETGYNSNVGGGLGIQAALGLLIDP